MALKSTDPKVLDLLAPGARVIVRDQEWQVEDVERQPMGTKAIARCPDRSVSGRISGMPALRGLRLRCVVRASEG